MVADVMESLSTHYKCYWNTFKQGNTQLKCKYVQLWKGRHQHHDYEDNIMTVITITKIAKKESVIMLLIYMYIFVCSKFVWLY